MSLIDKARPRANRKTGRQGGLSRYGASQRCEAKSEMSLPDLELDGFVEVRRLSATSLKLYKVNAMYWVVRTTFLLAANFLLVGMAIGDGCKSKYGNYVAVAESGDIAIEECRNGTFGLAIYFNGKSVWRDGGKLRFMSPSFSFDGKEILFAALDVDSRKTTVNRWELGTGRISKIYEDDGVLLHPVLSPDGAEVVFWSGKYRESGKTFATEFSLKRLALDRMKVSTIDGAFPIVYRPFIDTRGDLHYSYEFLVNNRLLLKGKRCRSREVPCSLVELENLSGEIAYTDRGYVFVAMQPREGRFQYCLKGAGVEARKICGNNKFAISRSGRHVAMIDQDRQQLHTVHVDGGK